MNRPLYPAVSPFRVALRKCCPRCGKGKLFQRFLKISLRCDHCNLNLENADSGDGPAVIIILILGFLVVAQMMALELAYAPPMWVHISVMTVVCLTGAYIMLPFFKGLMVALQYRTQSGD
ncbi:MAG: DUF983 domain-containing protein [Alphaproteobacteria bacterium]|nr:DUF983 domain-containing protein [Alphaproteobacteria bacterium]